MVATVHPFTLDGAPTGALIAVIVSMLVTIILLLIPVVGPPLTLVALSAVWLYWLFLVFRGLFGFARLSIWKDRAEYVGGLWPFINKRVIPIAEFKVEKLPIGWLPPKHIFHLELFAESLKQPAV